MPDEPHIIEVSGDVVQRVEIIVDESEVRLVEIYNPPHLGGNMYKSTYDPAGIENDAFDLAYHYGVLENAAAEIDGGLI